MTAGSLDALRLPAVGALGLLWQWVAFGPKKVPAWAAWGVLIGSSAALYFVLTPTVVADFAADWRSCVASLALFALSAKGAGSTGKALGIAPGTNQL